MIQKRSLALAGTVFVIGTINRSEAFGETARGKRSESLAGLSAWETEGVGNGTIAVCAANSGEPGLSSRQSCGFSSLW